MEVLKMYPVISYSIIWHHVVVFDTVMLRKRSGRFRLAVVCGEAMEPGRVMCRRIKHNMVRVWCGVVWVWTTKPFVSPKRR